MLAKNLQVRKGVGGWGLKQVVGAAREWGLCWCRGAARKTRKVRIEERTPPSSVEEEAEVDLRQLEADALDE